jgi:hypothetical protein
VAFSKGATAYAARKRYAKTMATGMRRTVVMAPNVVALKISVWESMLATMSTCEKTSIASTTRERMEFGCRSCRSRGASSAGVVITY